MREARLRELVWQAGRILDRLGLVDYLGHTSARIPGTDRVIVKPKHSPKIRGMASLRPDDLVVVDLDGNLADGEHRPPAEVFIHTEIYRARPDVTAIVHTHQPAATTAGVLGVPILPTLHVPATFVPADPPTWPCPLLVDNPARGRELAEHLGDQRFCHLQGHGIVSVAGDVREAVVGAAMLEQLAEVALRAEQTGRTPRVITDAEIAVLRGQLAGVDGRWAYYLDLANSAISSSV
ncbi:class II aldolase/adducin family protein [Amycolatopsis suaedae]|uniref:Class II aldolase/adducin family protein n=1 Tax=Amycolatopsis suaedae TaxID=2510978 RepID=A0A4V2EL97_9PSEU|nr:class II aldolase/adducin family protein [Amycolatopsis suaedae]RZQ60805.1 class II aldolase/adducin family protein [Amycolatopsis suaedae]